MGNLRQIVIAVAQIEKRKKALDLYESGMGASKISKKIKAPLRTVQRWIQQAKTTGLMQSLPEDSHDNSKADAKPTSVAQSDGHGLASILQLLSGGKLGAQAWGQAISQAQNEHRAIHHRIVLEIESLLISELTKTNDPVNMRAVHTLSIALTRHMDAEMRSLSAGRGDVLDLSQAMMRVKVAGMLAIREKQVPVLQAELRRLQESSPPAQQADELEAGVNPSSLPSTPPSAT